MLFLKRLIFYVYTLILTCLALSVTLLCLGVIKTDFVWTSLIVPATGADNFKIALTAAIVFFLGVWVLFSGFFKGKGKKSIAQYNLNDNVHVSIDAIEAFIEKAAKTTAGVRDAKVSVLVDSQNNIAATLNVSAGQEVNLEKVSSEMRENIKECVQNTLGVELTEIKVVVETISNEVKIKNRVR